MPSDGLDYFHRANLAEHQESRSDATQKLRTASSPLPIARAWSTTRDRASLTRARFTMLSRITASVTWR